MFQPSSQNSCVEPNCGNPWPWRCPFRAPGGLSSQMPRKTEEKDPGSDDLVIWGCTRSFFYASRWVLDRVRFRTFWPPFGHPKNHQKIVPSIFSFLGHLFGFPTVFRWIRSHFGLILVPPEPHFSIFFGIPVSLCFSAILQQISKIWKR